MLQDRVSNPGPLTYESAALPIALRGPATLCYHTHFKRVSDSSPTVISSEFSWEAQL